MQNAKSLTGSPISDAWISPSLPAASSFRKTLLAVVHHCCAMADGSTSGSKDKKAGGKIRVQKRQTFTIHIFDIVLLAPSCTVRTAMATVVDWLWSCGWQAVTNPASLDFYSNEARAGDHIFHLVQRYSHRFTSYNDFVYIYQKCLLWNSFRCGKK